MPQTPSTPDIPEAPDMRESYQQGAQVYLQYLPRFLKKEMKMRLKYDPQRIEEQQGLQDKYGPNQYRQMLDALKALDPTGYALREQTGKAISTDLAAGTSLTDAQNSELEQQIRRSQAARGNTYGQAPVQAEAFTKGKAGLELFQKRIAAALGFQNSATPEQWLTTIPPVSPDRSMAYVNPNAGFQGQQFALQNYQNQVAAAQLQTPGQTTSPWGSAIGSILGAAVGGYFGGPMGAQAGGSVGGTAGNLVGSAFSDRRLKKNIKPVGKIKGTKMYEFEYKDSPEKFIGAMADEVKKSNPDAVEVHPSGFMRVNYRKLGLPIPQPV